MNQPLTHIKYLNTLSLTIRLERGYIKLCHKPMSSLKIYSTYDNFQFRDKFYMVRQLRVDY